MNLRNFIEDLNKKHPFSGDIKFDEPMSMHTTFKTGGPADLFVKPDKAVFLAWTSSMLKAAKARGIPVFILGGGANILVSDKGIRGIVLDTGCWEGLEADDSSLWVRVLSGTSIKNLTEHLAKAGFSSMEFLAGMPGSVGGAVYMNARAYSRSVSDQLLHTEILDENFDIVNVPFNKADFAYKKSPFQNRNIFILSASFRITIMETAQILKTMEENIKDREEKGQYRFPSAGSVFKNNSDFGEPSGKIIANLGLRGKSIGDAQIAPWHGNLIINKGNASSKDIRLLMDEVVRRVKEEKGFSLENEVLFAGEW